MEFNAVGVEGALGVVGDRNVPPPLTPVSGNAGALGDLGELCESPSSLSVIFMVVYFRDATLAKDIHVPATRIYAIIKEGRSITADTALRLERYFGLSEGYFLRLQA